jgi:hypothetical protein
MRRQLTHLVAGGAALALGLGLIACDNRTLRVTAPDVVQPSALDNPAALPTVTAAVYADFGYAYAGDGGDDEGIIQQGGLLGDEFHSSDTFPTRNQIDIRETTTDNAQLASIFARIQRARATGEFAVKQYQGLEPGVALEAEALTFVGVAYLLAGETYCSGIPFSSVNPNGTVTYGPLEPTAQVWHDARARFDSALAILAADKTDAAADIAKEIAYASVEKGRMLVDSGDYADAALAVAAVPDGFVFDQGYAASPSRVNNGVWEYNLNEGRFSVADSEGQVGLPYRTDNDPRVQQEPAYDLIPGDTNGFDHVTQLFAQLKYPSRSASIPIASDIEARLIEAEAALAAGKAGLFLTKINAARTDAGTALGVTVPTAGSVPAGMTNVQFLFQERAFGLWLTAHRLGDMRREMRQYGMTANQVYPNGAYPKGGVYGTQITMPIPIGELANPNYKACDDTQP